MDNNNQEKEIQENPTEESSPVTPSADQETTASSIEDVPEESAEETTEEATEETTEETNEETPKKQKNLKKLICVALIIIVGICVSVFCYVSSDSYKYDKAQELMSEKNYSEAIEIFKQLGNYEDSKDKIPECKRRILYEYLKKNDGFTITNPDYTYELKAENDTISIRLPHLDLKDDRYVEFSLCFDMTSDKAEFRCDFSSLALPVTTSKGDCEISKLLSNDNSLEIDSNSGPYTVSLMQDLVNVSCDLLCVHFNDALEEIDLGITPADIGFTSLD